VKISLTRLLNRLKFGVCFDTVVLRCGDSVDRWSRCTALGRAEY